MSCKAKRSLSRAHILFSFCQARVAYVVKAFGFVLPEAEGQSKRIFMAKIVVQHPGEADGRSYA
jgi:hypothetical protein